MADFTIYLGNKNYSSWSLRPWLALRHTGVSFAEILIPLDQPDSTANIRRHSPSGRVPALQHGNILVWESLAICEYLAEAFPAARLWPVEPAARAHARAVSNEMHAGFAALRDKLPMDIRSRWPLGDRMAAAGDDIGRVTAIWRECRERFGARGANGAGEYLYGGFTIADAMFAPVTTRFVTYGVPLEPVSVAYVEAVTRSPAMQAWAAAAAKEPWTIHHAVNDAMA